MDPRVTLAWVVALVYLRTLWGAARTFRRVEYAWRTQLLGVSFWIYGFAAFRGRLYEPGLIPGLLLLACGAALFEWSTWTVRGRFFSIMGTHDTPQFVFDQGPFAYIRHPFYTSYLLMHAGTTLLFHSALTILTLIATVALVWESAIFEEEKFAHSPQAQAYRDYMRRSGRFWPRPAGRR